MDTRRRISFNMNTGGGSTPDNPGTGGDISGPINTDNYLTILALEDGLTAKLSNTCQYCIDGDGNWINLPAGTTTQSINSGQTLSFKGNLTPKSSTGIGTFTINKKCNIEGNCISMLFGDDAVNNNSLYGKDYAFCKLFDKCANIIHVSEAFLPATTLVEDCYYYMFSNCTSLTTAPELPATTLAYECYRNMFQNCTSLTTAPALPATELNHYCYASMFYGCTSLTSAPELPATNLYSVCYSSMFYGCTSLTTAPALPATTLAGNCYRFMFYNTNVLPDCSNIDFNSNAVVKSGGLKGLFGGTKVTDSDLYNILPINPATGKYWLPATTLARNCYEYMFQNCTSLTTAPELPATTLAGNCYYYMFSNCTNLTTAPKLPATTLEKYCYNQMFSNCTSLTTAPELLATTLTDYCYYQMFYGCRKLSYIKMLATNISASNCLSLWVASVASTGTFVKNPAMTSLSTGASGIPSGWTVVDDN